MPPTAPHNQSPANAHKKRAHLVRLWFALGFSLAGIAFAWRSEKAFRAEVLLGITLIPIAWWKSAHWNEFVWLVFPIFLIWITELLNTAIESCVNLCTTDWHVLAGRAKDTASAAVLMALLFFVLIWGSWIWHLFT